MPDVRKAKPDLCKRCNERPVDSSGLCTACIDAEVFAETPMGPTEAETREAIAAAEGAVRRRRRARR